MTLRLTISIDPGLTGAIAVLADGVPVNLFDMPVIEVDGWSEVDGPKLFALVRGICAGHRGAWISGCVEKVQAMPKDGGTSAFRFGDSYRAAKAAFEALNIPYSRVTPVTWKRYYGLLKQDKDAGRQLAIKRFPQAAKQLTRKKDHGRADALLLGLWHENNEMGSQRAA